MNIFDLPPLPANEELTTILAQNKSLRIQRIVSTGQTSQLYDQEECEFVAVLQGSAVLEFENGKTRPLTIGDTVIIEPHELHRVVYTSTAPPCVWLCVFWEKDNA